MDWLWKFPHLPLCSFFSIWSNTDWSQIFPNLCSHSMILLLLLHQLKYHQLPILESKEYWSYDLINPKEPGLFVQLDTRWGGKGWLFITEEGQCGGTFRLHFWNQYKIGMKESIDLNSVRFGRRCNIGWVTIAFIVSLSLPKSFDGFE